MRFQHLRRAWLGQVCEQACRHGRAFFSISRCLHADNTSQSWASSAGWRKTLTLSAESGDILISFLNAALELEAPYRIEAVEILDPYLAPKIKGMKDSYLDVKVKDGQGRSYIVEMQVLNVAGFEKRILYNACKAYAGQIARGEDYHLLTDVVALTITDFVMFDDLPERINKFKLRAAAGEVYVDDLELVFIELPKFKIGKDEEEKLETTKDRWLYFLKYADDLRAVPANLSLDPAILHAFEIANKAALTPEELDDQERREMFIQDQRGALTKALEIGEAKGRAEGLAEGRAEGRAEGLEEGEAKGWTKGLTEALTRLIASGMPEVDARQVLGRKRSINPSLFS
ncbi:MAG: Rpn family recombination-promoting nuclease/putative transposase [Betaproteobacteria bacterium]|nr:Rpn family recombination-promoting nuclease/putative transposase [Betaproteobacteria bacterium]